MRPLFVIGRALFGGFFIYNGINHLARSASMEAYAQSKGVPSPVAAVNGTAALLLAGGISVVAGLKPTTLQMHRFWEQEDPQQRMGEMVNFTKNVALIGAALALMQVNEPWPASVDSLRAPDEDMYVRLGGRDFRGLPA